MTIALILFLSFVIGGIPFGLLFTRMAGLGDIRAIGSGNIGATNVLRTGNKKIAALTLLCDGLKGCAVVTIMPLFTTAIPSEKLALVVILGHIFSPFLKFKGGKGVATAIGAFLALNIYLGLAIIITWLLSAKIFKISSLSALLAFSFAPLFSYGLNLYFNIDINVLSIISIVFIIFYTHRENIKRILSNTENEI